MQGDAQQPAALLPCPFCGAPGEYNSVQDWHGVGCQTRNCPGVRSALHHRSKEAAFSAWNHRALLAAQAQPREPWWKDPRNFESAEAMLELESAAAPPVPAQAAPSMEAPTVEAGPWKAANEFLPYHPSASHVRPAYRDGWNACWRAMQATHPTTAAPAGVPSEIELIAQQWDGCMYDAGPGGDIDIGKAIRLAARASSPSGASQEALTGSKLREAAAFLLGEAALDGVWFGDPHPTEKGAFWWRKHLRAAMEQQHAQEQEGTNHGTS